MRPDDANPVDDDFASWAAEYDEALGAGRLPESPPPLSADPYVARRQRQFLECLRRLENDRSQQDLAATLGASEEHETVVLLPAELGRFRLVHVLGGGAFGVVYLAFDPR